MKNELYREGLDVYLEEKEVSLSEDEMFDAIELYSSGLSNVIEWRLIAASAVEYVLNNRKRKDKNE